MFERRASLTNCEVLPKLERRRTGNAGRFVAAQSHTDVYSPCAGCDPALTVRTLPECVLSAGVYEQSYALETAITGDADADPDNEATDIDLSRAAAAAPLESIFADFAPARPWVASAPDAPFDFGTPSLSFDDGSTMEYYTGRRTIQVHSISPELTRRAAAALGSQLVPDLPASQTADQTTVNKLAAGVTQVPCNV